MFKSAAFFPSLHDTGLDTLTGRVTHLVAFDVIEHVPAEAMPQLLSRMRSLLREDGLLVLRFPNGDSPFRRQTQHRDPTHVTTLGRINSRFLLEMPTWLSARLVDLRYRYAASARHALVRGAELDGKNDGRRAVEGLLKRTRQ